MKGFFYFYDDHLKPLLIFVKTHTSKPKTTASNKKKIIKQQVEDLPI